MKGYIDCHSHVWTPDLAKYPLAPGFKREQMQPPSWTPDELMAHAKPEGVDRVVLIQMSFYEWDNSYLLDCLHSDPGRFAAVALVDWTQDEPQREMSRLANQGVRGFRVRPGSLSPANWAETPSMRKMFEFAGNHGLAICPLIEPDCLRSLSRMADAHPQTNVVIDHFARGGIDGVIRHRDVENLASLAVHPNVYVKVSAFYALGSRRPPHEDLEPMVRRLHSAYGARRLMWGSDCPFAVEKETYADAIGLIRDGCPWLSAEDRRRMLQETAAGVFF